MAGFANATQFSFGGNKTECQFALEGLVHSANDATEVLLRDWFSWFDFWKAIDLYLVVPYSLYSVNFACTESLYEIG